MPKRNYQVQLNNLKARRSDPILNKAFVTESFNRANLPITVRYVFESMVPIDEDYTKRTYKEAERVQKQIIGGLETNIEVDFDYQGSVPLNTHIRLHSDLDILTFHNGFFSLEPPLAAINPYIGDPIADLRKLRTNIYNTLSKVYYAAKVDNFSAKAVSIKGGSLSRKFDIIICNWYETVVYQHLKRKELKGIHIYDQKKDNRFSDFPFTHMSEVEKKSAAIPYDNFKRLVRLFKTLKADAEASIDMSSFMITSILYHMPESKFNVLPQSSTVLLVNASEHLNEVLTNETFRKSLKSPNKKEYLFQENDQPKVIELYKLKKELDETIVDLADELSPGIRTLNEQFHRNRVSSYYEPLQKAFFNY